MGPFQKEDIFQLHFPIHCLMRASSVDIWELKHALGRFWLRLSILLMRLQQKMVQNSSVYIVFHSNPYFVNGEQDEMRKNCSAWKKTCSIQSSKSNRFWTCSGQCFLTGWPHCLLYVEKDYNDCQVNDTIISLVFHPQWKTIAYLWKVDHGLETQS